MSGFHKITESCLSVTGTKLKNNLLVLSSGIPSLDYVIGGGLPTGGIFAVESDVLGSYSRVLTKYFIAEGVVCKHDLLLFSADENPEEIVKELPQPCVVQKDDKINKVPQDEMKIAWRYEGLSQVESSFDNETNFGHHFDLSRYIDTDTIKKSNITYCFLNPIDNGEKGAFRNGLFTQTLNKIKDVLANDLYRRSSKNKNILRISIHMLGSPIWMSMDCDEEPLDNKYGHDLIKFMYCLRILLRDTNAVAFITIPSHLFDDDHIMNRLLYSMDNAVRIESFAGSDKETNPVFNEYHGLFHLTKLSALYSLVPFVPSSLDLAFKLKRKKFVIEKLHLPPELEESSEREQDDITAVPRGCGGFRKKDIEF
ncbi:putative elongator complex protein 4 [Pieris rapae]|uniref:putative elongator complex protein 4 n=1 Tax=Pieris rapae TaxID=64459 RepID=UPI001E27FE82|nr:putative elongator complex protein 4 [Pieris rapae]